MSGSFAAGRGVSSASPSFDKSFANASPGLIEALPTYYPSLDGVRAFAVFIVVLFHIANTVPSPLDHFMGWIGVDIFFVLSGFLITGLLLREEKLTGTVDLAAFYIRRAFRILPLYWVVLAVYVIGLQQPSQLEKWTKMKLALPYFLTFNNDIPLVLMFSKVGPTFGLSWTLGVEEKFYFFWPLICFVLLSGVAKRIAAGWTVYAATFSLAVFSIKWSAAYSGLIVGALLAMLLASSALPATARAVRKIPASAICILMVGGFVLVAIDKKWVFAFSWIACLMVASLTLKDSWLSRFLSLRPLVWLGKRSYAMYLIQGFAINAVEVLLKPKNVPQILAVAMGAYVVAAAGSALLHRLIEEPARRLGRKIVLTRNARKETFLQRAA